MSPDSSPLLVFPESHDYQRPKVLLSSCKATRASQTYSNEGEKVEAEAETKTPVSPAEPAWNDGTEVAAEADWPSKSTKAKAKTQKEPVRVTKGQVGNSSSNGSE